MKKLINDEGRECTCCGEFKEWGEYGNKKRSARGKQPTCTKCKNDLRYAEKHGCLKEDNIDPKHYDADKIMRKYISREYREKSKFYKELFKKEKILKRGRYDDLGRECNDCGRYKYWKFFNKNGKADCPNRRKPYCKECSRFRSVEYRKNNPREYIRTRKQKDKKNEQRKKSKANKIKKAIELASGNIDINNGFIYLYRCEELDCFKIGRTVDDPREYVKIKSSSSNGNYGIKLDLVAYIVSPIRGCDAEWLATKSLKHKRVEYTKPCGGQARELFRCGLYEALLILRGISDEMYIEPNPFVSLDDLGAVEIDVHVPSKNDRRKMKRADGVVARKLLRKMRSNKPWNVVMDDYTSACVCRSIKPRRGVYINKNDLSSKINFCKKQLHLGKHGTDKDLIITKFKSVFDLRDKLFINGRYIEGAEAMLKDEIDRVRGV